MRCQAITCLVCCVTLLGLNLVQAKQAEDVFILYSNITDSKATVYTDSGPKGTVLDGQLALQARVVPGGELLLSLSKLNLVSEGVQLTKGFSGPISIKLTADDNLVKYDQQSGEFFAAYRASLHYELMDELLGFQQSQAAFDMNYVPNWKLAKARISGRLPANLTPKPGAKAKLNAKVSLSLDDPELGPISFVCVISISALWERWGLEDAQYLWIQPVFIGSGPADPTASGWAFRPLILNAADMWNRCGSVNCVQIRVEDPVYIDDDSYRVINNESELFALAAEVNLPGVVEVFVVERFETVLAVMTGGGGTIRGGTAAAKIVTSDEQLDVPCPPPCPDGGLCGPLNDFHLAHEIGHVFFLDHPTGDYSMWGFKPTSFGSVMEGSGYCLDNPNAQSAMNCRNIENPILTWGRAFCDGTPDIMD